MKKLTLFILLLLSISIIVSADVDSIKDKALQITKNDRTDSQKVESLVYWIYNNIKFDYVLAECKNCSRNISDTPQYVFNNRKGVCSGFSNLYRYMSNSIGLTSYVIGGSLYKKDGTRYLDKHAWNLTKTTNGYIFVDATWNEITTNKNNFEKTHEYEYIYYEYSISRIGNEYYELFMNSVNNDNEYLTDSKSYEYYDNKNLINSKELSEEIKLNIELRDVYNFLSKTSSSIPKVLTMSLNDFNKIDKKDFELVIQYRNELRNYIESKEGKSRNYYKIDTTLKSVFWDNVNKIRKLHEKGRI
jgi:hypothetical protein